MVILHKIIILTRSSENKEENLLATIEKRAIAAALPLKSYA